uniref:NADH-ubiquinone oxidoreductase chain 6 n=1 Tax=Phyllotreta hemipoda TaxID=1425528 RepID=A0A3G1GSL5_9CUCU|nr:NADH dehydrogenase subunit 6 [Phyllotreta hemipoda]
MLMLVNTILLFFLKHPLSFGMILLIQTIYTCLLSGLLNLNFWYSYILFLILVGGMLILFIYMTSIASNEKFKFNFFSLMFMIMGLMFSIINPLNMDMNISDLMMFSTNLNFKLSLTKYYYYPNIFIYLMMIIYLFITLILTVKITKLSYGPLRQKF